MSVHSGHRKRVRDRFLTEGLDNFPPHNVLELLLFYALPQRDTNELAHRLIERFGQQHRLLVLERSPQMLQRGFQTQKLAERIPAQVSFFLELLDVLGSRASRAGFKQAASGEQRHN